MKKHTLKITKGLKALMFAGSIAVASLFGHGFAVKHTLAFVPFALVAGMKKKGITLSAEEEKTMQGMEDEMNAAWKSMNDEARKGLLTADEFAAKLEEKKADLLSDIAAKSVMLGEGDARKSIEDVLREQGQAIADAKKAMEGGTPGKPESLLDMITKALNDNIDGLKGLMGKQKGAASLVMEIKASNTTISTGYASSAPNSFLPVPVFMPGIHTSPEIKVTIMDLVDMGTSESPVITWVNEQPIEGDAGWTAEGALKSQVAWKYTSETSSAKKVTAFVKVTDESLKDIPFLAGRINTRLRELILRKIQSAIINGSGSGNEPEGIVPQAPGFVTNSFDDSVDSPTIADVLMAMAGQIDELEYETDNLVAVMNGVDIRKMKWEKDANGNYIIPPFTTANGTYVDNMRVVKNNKIAKGYALVGDLKRFMVLMVDGLVIEIGLDGNDFTYNLRTVRAEARLITAISDNDLGAFVYDAIATVKQEIDAAV